jgi:hypothetical protein
MCVKNICLEVKPQQTVGQLHRYSLCIVHEAYVKVFGRHLAFPISFEFGSYNKKTFLLVLFKKYGDSRHFLDQWFEVLSGSVTDKTAVIPSDCHIGVRVVITGTSRLSSC